MALTEAEYWELQGLAGSYLSHVFDHEWYHAAARREGLKATSSTRLGLIDHFCTTGRFAQVPLAPEHRFDPNFYIEHWLQISETAQDAAFESLDRDALRLAYITKLTEELGLSSAADLADVSSLCTTTNSLYQHWLLKGLRKGCAPNVIAWAKTYLGLNLPPSLAARLQQIAHATVEDYGSLLDRLTRLLREPMRYLDHMPDLELDEAIALSTMGDKMAMEGNHDQAEWLYRTVLTQYPNHERSLNHLADLMTRLHRKGAEYQLRVEAYALPGKKRGGSVWNALALAEPRLELRP